MESGEYEQSALPFLELDSDSLEIAPLSPATATLQFRAPRDARGTYVAALLAETPAPEQIEGGVVVRIRFLIPVIFDIQGRPARQDVRLEEPAMAFVDESGQAPTTVASMTIANAGQTLSRVEGTIIVERRSGDSWRTVTRSELRERSILPGMTLELLSDLERRLPSGEYRLRGELTVDGRRLAPVVREIDFEGDPTIDSVAYDTELRLTPGLVELDVVPGATRTGVFRIENPGENPVQVRLASATPRELLGVRMGELDGTDISAASWTRIQPETFTLRAGGSQNVRVISALPGDAAEHGNFYANMILSGTYPDGQSAGSQNSIVHLSNAAVPSMPDGVVEQLGAAEAEAGIYAVQVRFVNTGNVHLEPNARLLLVTPQGQSVRNVGLTSDEGMLLPLARRIYGGELSLEGLDPGVYGLRAVLDLGDGVEVAGQQIAAVEAGPDGGAMRLVLLEGEDFNPEATEAPADE
ncbi:hypothetical protein [Wenxinia marina]|uniref:Uncharacterized protein n=1 Tax=Wenxinia marina DSM 24838 TaxID=1123501 RepID=A0A0D0QAC5_9RHOB|nr:hypothetical protein [Wenxinia marina]KIQ69267.1 hypothetical protein Wenmar_02338 [Wenxinia marina DSM 24838]GGL71670.1 hypothetical protein GCM10011392_27850 [Wenxinia marina]